MELNNKSLFIEKCFVNGQWSDSQNGKTIEVNNPATLEIIGKVPNFSGEETKSVIDHASHAFQSWKNTTAKERSIILKNYINEVPSKAKNGIAVDVFHGNEIDVNDKQFLEKGSVLLFEYFF